MAENVRDEVSEWETVVNGLVAILWAGTNLDGVLDLLDLLAAVLVMRPEARRVRAVIAWRYMRSRLWTEAPGELRRNQSDGWTSPLNTALTGVCLYALGDPLCRGHLHEAADQLGDPSARSIALALLRAPGVMPDQNEPKR